MMASTYSETRRTIPLLIAVCLVSFPVYAKYAGGSGTAQDPYQIATAADLILLGDSPLDYDKHFVLTANIDLDPNLPGRKVFDRAVIAPIMVTGNSVQGTSFSGVFDGKGHTISRLVIMGAGYLGVFGRLSGEVRELGLVNVRITGPGSYVGGLVGQKVGGSVTQCYSTGAVSGISYVGGLVGGNSGYSYSRRMGPQDSVLQCYSTGAVNGDQCVGGLMGSNGGTVTDCYSTGAVSGKDEVGGLVGCNSGGVTRCYGTSAVSGSGEFVGGLVGCGSYWEDSELLGQFQVDGTATGCFWDTQTSGLATSAGGTGKTTPEMQTAGTFLGWNGCGPLWTIKEGQDYPRLTWENVPGEVIADPTYAGGTGTALDPYLIYTADQLNVIGLASCQCNKHFKLMADIDLSGFDGKEGRPEFKIIGTGDYNPFTGVFDGNGHTLSHLTIKGVDYVGLFGYLGSGAEVKDLGVVDVNTTGSGDYVGGLVGYSYSGGLTRCYSTGAVSGNGEVGGLVGHNDSGALTQCYSTGAVTGTGRYGGVGGLVGHNFSGGLTQCYSAGVVTGTGQYGEVGGLVGHNDSGGLTQCYSAGTVTGTGQYGGVGGLVGYNTGKITNCHSTGSVSGIELVGGLVGSNGGGLDECYSTGLVSGRSYYVGGLVGSNQGNVTHCRSTAAVNGTDYVGGLVGLNNRGTVTQCYSTGAVSGTMWLGGLVPWNYAGRVTDCFWDTQTSGRATSDGGTGKTTAQMQTAKTFLDAGWDFVGETTNGPADLWWIVEGKDYPHLWWEAVKK